MVNITFHLKSFILKLQSGKYKTFFYNGSVLESLDIFIVGRKENLKLRHCEFVRDSD